MALPTHPQTQAHIAAFVATPSHALLLSGPQGSGKTELALDVAAQLLQDPHFSLQDNPYVQLIQSPDGKAIGIEAIRELEHFLVLKVPSRAATNRVIIIENAQNLGLEAQNALLKTLEEPPKGTVLIMTVDHDQALLPTIRSRTQNIAVKLPMAEEITQYFANQGHDAAAIQRAYSISGGLPSLMNAMLTDAEHPLTAATSTARELLGQSVYERLLRVDELAKQKDQLPDILFIMQQMAHVSLQTATGPAAKRWQTILTAAYNAQADLIKNAQPKLVLDKLFLTL